LDCAESELKDGKITEVPGTGFSLDAELVLLATGFIHPEHEAVVDPPELAKDERGNIKTDGSGMTSCEGVFAAGDAASGPSLVVRAIADGRKAAAGADSWLSLER
jgi:glutamate synthase (NADPH/NADH) small chain